MSFVSNFGRQIFTVFLAAQRYLRDLASKRYFRTNCIHSIRLRTTSKAGIFPFTFSIFFRETTFLESNAGGPPTGGSHRAGLVVSKKKKENKKKGKFYVSAFSIQTYWKAPRRGAVQSLKEKNEKKRKREKGHVFIAAQINGLAVSLR